MRTSLIVPALAAVLLLPAGVFADPIEKIRPSDGIASIRINAYAQRANIDVTFAEDMIPLGGGHGEFPVSLEGPGSCDWGWRGPRTLTCTTAHDEPLPLAQRYAIVVAEGLTTIDGDPVPPYRLEFETDLPAVSESDLDWLGPTSPVLFVQTNVPVAEQELQRRVRLVPLSGQAPPVAVTASQDAELADKWPAATRFVLKPVADLEPDTAYSIRVEAGLIGTAPGLRGVDHAAGGFRTHSAFRFLGIGCDSNPERPTWAHRPLVIAPSPECAPEQPVVILFSAEPDLRNLYQTLTQAGLDPTIASSMELTAIPLATNFSGHYRAVEYAYGISLSGFPAGKPVVVDLPDAIRDRFARALPPATAEFTMLDFVPAFLGMPVVDVVASGSGSPLTFAAVSTDTVVARLRRDGTPELALLELPTDPVAANVATNAELDVEKLLGKSWGALIGEVAVSRRAYSMGGRVRDFPLEYVPMAGAILTPWDVVMATKDYDGGLRHSLWVSRLDDGAPVDGATVEFLARPAGEHRTGGHIPAAYTSRAVLGKGRTDASGYAEVVPTNDDASGQRPSMVRVTKGDAVVVLPIDENRFQHSGADHRFSGRRHAYPRYGTMAEGSAATWGITDKPLYRQGETVRVKGYVRVREDNRLVIPAGGGEWKLACRGQHPDLCAGRSVTLDAYGAFETTIELPDAVPDGEYSVVAYSGSGARGTLTFRVANYRPKAHRVDAAIDAGRITGDAPVPVRATAEYFAGGPLRNAHARVSIVTRSTLLPIPVHLLERYEFGHGGWDTGNAWTTVIDASFDGNGRLSGSFPLPDGSPASGTATVTVSALHDGGEWAYSEPLTVAYEREPFVLGLGRDERELVVGEPYVADVMLLSHGGDDDDLTVVQTLEYATWRHTERTQPAPDVSDECSVRIQPGTPVSCELVPRRIGRPVIRARLVRNGETLLEEERHVRVALQAHPFRIWGPSDRLTLEPREERFEAGRTAAVDIDVPYERASIIFTLNRNGVFQQWREVLRKGRRTVRFPLTELHAPGFTLTAIARPVGLGPGTSIGTVDIDVASAEVVPSLSLETDRTRFKAGDEVRLTVASTAAGRSQLAIAVIDEAVLDLVPGVDALYEPQGEGLAGLLRHWARFSWWQLARAMGGNGAAMPGLEEITVSANRALVRHFDGAAMAMMAAPPETGSGEGPALRREFAEAAYFNASVLTADNGIAEVAFRVPDNLGQWRIVVVGADTAGHVFSNSHSIDVALPLEVRASLPARVVQGDTLAPTATVLNRKDESNEVTLSLTVDAGDARANGGVTARLGSMESASASAAIRDIGGAELRLAATATDTDDGDGLEISTPVVDPVETRSWTSTMPVAAGKPYVQPVELPSNALPPSATLRITLDRSVIGDVSQAFHYMQEPLHRNWEQVLSRAVMAAYRRQWDAAGIPHVANEEITNLLLQGSNFMTFAGGMSYFETAESWPSDYLSAYTLLALHWLEEQGVPSPGYVHSLAQFVHQRVERGLRPPNRAFGRDEAPSARNMTTLIAALSTARLFAGNNPDRYLDYLRTRAVEFDAEELAYALIAATNYEAPEDLKILLTERLEAQLVETFDRIEIADGDSRFGNPNELHCVILSALQHAGDGATDARTLMKLVRGTYEFRDERSGFGNSHANAQCIVALTRYRDAFESPTGALAVEVTSTNAGTLRVDLASDTPMQVSDDVVLPTVDLRTSVSVSVVDGESAFASANVRYEVDLAREIARSHGYTLKRTYSVYRGDAWQELAEGDGIEQGAWVRIDLDVVSPVVRRFVAVTDPTPAGLEPVDTALVPGIPMAEVRARYWWRAFNQRALSNVRSSFYSEWLYAGSHRVTYYAQARFVGEFLALPARVESMYSDGVFAATAPQTLRIVPAE